MGSASSNSRGGVEILVINSVFMALAIVFVGLRFLAIRMRRRSCKLHDYAIIVALAFALTVSGVDIAAVVAGSAGLHITEVQDPLASVVLLQKLFFTNAFLWLMSSAAIKLSILALYIDLFPTPKFRVAVFTMIGLLSAWFVALMLTFFLLCRPFKAYWDLNLVGKRGNQTDEQVAVAASNLVVDTLIMILPMPVLWGLQMPTRKKIGIACIFTLGLSVCVVNILRVVKTKQANFADLTYAVIDTVNLSILELCLGIIVACMPCTVPIWAQLASSRIFSNMSDLSRLLGRTTGRGSGNNSKRDQGGNMFGSYTRATASGPVRPHSNHSFDKAYFSALHDDDVPLKEQKRALSQNSEVSAAEEGSVPREQSPVKINVRRDWRIFSSPRD